MLLCTHWNLVAHLIHPDLGVMLKRSLMSQIWLKSVIHERPAILELCVGYVGHEIYIFTKVTFILAFEYVIWHTNEWDMNIQGKDITAVFVGWKLYKPEAKTKKTEPIQNQAEPKDYIFGK